MFVRTNTVSSNPTYPQPMSISIAQPKPAKQTGLKRPLGDGNIWTFQIIPEEGIVWVEGPNWSYPGKGAGADPDWGQWSGGDGELWLSWTSPQLASAFTIKVKGKIACGGGGGDGGGISEPIDIEASWEGEVEPFRIEFEGLARACAGGVAVDGVHDFSVTAIAKDKDGAPLPGITLKFSFENNKGHDYGDGTPIRRAKYIVGAGQTEVEGSDGEAMTAITDAEGKVPVHVLSSDIVSSDIEMKVSWENPLGEEEEVGGQACDFGEAVSKRNFALDPEQVSFPSVTDNGWWFTSDVLISGGDQTVARLYLKFDKGDDEVPVNGHTMRISIDEISLEEDGNNVSPADYSRYIYFVNSAGERLKNGELAVQFVDVTTSTSDPNDPKSQGYATVYLKGGPLIYQAATIRLKAIDLTQIRE